MRIRYLAAAVRPLAWLGMITCVQNTPGLSGTVAHLELRSPRIRWDRPVSGRVVVSLGGQPEALDRRFSVKT